MKNVTVCMLLVLVMTTGLASAEVVRWIPVAASNAGENDTQWTTELWILSRVLDGPIDVHIAFLPDVTGTTDPTEVTVELPAISSVHIEDVVGSLFGEGRPGALRLRSEFAFEVQSRTFNTGGDGGTFGQGIPALTETEGRNGWILLGAANRPGEDGVRCNLGLLNTDDRERDVLLFVIDQATGESLGEAPVRVAVGGNGWTQFNVFDLIEQGDLEVDNAIVLGAGFPGILGYLSRIDNLSGDATFILPVEAETEYSIPAEWEVTLTVAYSVAVTIDTLVYTGEDGEDVTVTNPPSTFETTLHIMSPAEFCYTLTSADNSEAGSATIKVLRARGGNSGAMHTHTGGIGGDESQSTSQCFDLK